MRNLVVAGIFGLLVLVGASAAALTGPDHTTPDDSHLAPEPLESEWDETYGGDGDDRLASVTPTGDGYVLTGWSEGEESVDGWALKIDEDGDVRWEKRFGGDAFDKLYAALPADDGYLLVGENGSADGSTGWLVKITDDGEIEWERTYGSGGFRAGERTDEGYLLAGWTRADGGVDSWAMHVDGGGEVEWEQTYDGPAEGTDDYLKSIVVDNVSESDDSEAHGTESRGGYLFAGISESEDGSSGWAIRADADGTATWSNAYGNETINDVWAAANAADGGYVLTGETGDEEVDGRDAWVLRVGEDGDLAWERTYGGEEYDWFDAVIRTPDGYIFTGGTKTGDFGSADGYLVRTDADGELALETSFGSSGWDKSWPIVEANDEGYLLVGETTGFDADGQDGWVTKMTDIDSNATANESAINGRTEAATDGPAASVDGSAELVRQSGFTVVVALVALVVMIGAVALRRRG